MKRRTHVSLTFNSIGHLFALCHVILYVACADTGDEPSRGLPCPFASRQRVADGWTDTAQDSISGYGEIRKGYNDIHDDLIFFGSFEEHETSLEMENQVGNIIMKGQSTSSTYPMETGENAEVDNRRMLQGRRNKHKQGRKRDKNSTGKRNKRGKNNTSKRGKRGKSKKTGRNPSLRTRCFSNSTYDSIDDDIAKLRKFIRDDVTRSHFLGGIVRLAAHDFMDYDKRDRSNPMGPDGCFDESQPMNKGLPESVWCKSCLLRRLYEERYNFLSRADFWIASANAVIRQTSEKNALNLRDTFRWGRKDRSSCRGSADRLPDSKSCKDVESTFLTRMGLEWKDAVALLGAHSLGRGSAEFSGHEGTWVDNAHDAQLFDKQYYEELVFNAWRPRNVGEENQDWTTGNNMKNQRMMLNTDICLVFNIDNNILCCTKTDDVFQNGQSKCMDINLAREQCPLYSKQDRRWAATEAVVEYIGGSRGSKNNEPFYNAFAVAWEKATTNGWDDLLALSEDCEST
ncbi:hypothetical protein HJC23_003572 [Cyclotella cryptica]|uniref:Plant heme peroxidase family profile domain-containing protein n=1 Tax=Cyclotella cryptica TaxID=29204 RepID=A0ABD3NPZ0_9STRA|eukprot:CCRYP_020209-RA/>CCRYP_020209-RA protein AED:0.00 eAED:0.00 QI:0/-1/0/1/-1/1/1/0/513